MMKNTKRIITILLFIVAFIVIYATPVFASAATSYTLTLNAKGEFVRTQDAYLPLRTTMELNLNKPEDMMFDDDGFLWIADTGNMRILKYDSVTNELLFELTYPEFLAPKGLYISSRGLYVADSAAKAVFRFDLDGTFIEKFERPDSLSFGETSFEPSKIAVDNRGNLYIYGEGVSNGIIQLSNIGEFLGFFTTNKIRLSVVQQFQKLILTPEQFDNLLARSPQTFSSIFIDDNSMVYTTTMSTYFNAVKKHNTQGGNIFKRMISFDDARDIYVDKEGIVYAGMQSGAIFVYDQTGDFIFYFGASNSDISSNQDISGVFQRLSSIAVRDDGVIFALDDAKSFLQSFEPTAYAKEIYRAINLYEDRLYQEAIDAWSEVLNLNQMSVIAHNNIAKSYLQLQDYESAMHHFELAGNRTGYSEASWEVRNLVIQSYLGIFIIALIFIYFSNLVLHKVDKKTGKVTQFTQPIKKSFDKPILRELSFMFKIMRKPIDSFEDLKHGHQGSFRATLILYVAIFITFIFFNTSKGFIYQYILVEDIDITALVLGFTAVTLLFVICNYLDTSINDGIGKLKQIFMMFVYALGPLFLALLLVTLLSHVLTYNEVFFLDFIMTFGTIWSFILIYLGISEIHEYSGKETIRSIFMSLLFAIIIVVVLIIIITMWQQLYLFLDAIIKELIRNVFN
jgi:sugar lactone lactonase YvrE